MILDLEIQFKDENGNKYTWYQSTHLKIQAKNNQISSKEIPLELDELEKTIQEIRDKLYYLLPNGGL